MTGGIGTGQRGLREVACALLAAVLTAVPMSALPGEEGGENTSLIPTRRALGAEEAAFARSSLDLARALGTQGRWGRAVDLLRATLVALDGGSASTVELRTALGDLLWKRGDLTEAEDLLLRAVEEASERENATVASDALYHLGEVAYVKALAVGDSDFEEAIRLHRQALEIREQEGAPAAVSLSLSRLGTIEEILGRADKALDLFHQALELSRRTGDDRGSIRPLTHIAGHHERRGEWDRALELHRRALETSQRLGDWESLVFGLCNVGEAIWRHSVEHETAASYLDEALVASEEMGFVLAVVRASMARGELLADRGEVERARAAFAKAEAEATAASYDRLVAGIRARIQALATDGT